MRPDKPRGRWGDLTGPAFSPRGLLARAAILATAYLAAHLAGLRWYVTILSGTSPSGDPSDVFAMGLGVLYVMLHLAFTLIAPVLVIAAGLLAGYLALRGKAPQEPPAPDTPTTPPAPDEE